ncbi:MAG: trypsin-like peptidase domain-containing protein [Patescibacteria group bacterium]
MSLNSSIVKIVKKVMPAVVSIVISENIESIPKQLINLRLKKKLKRYTDTFGDIEVGGGSGFIVDESGIVLTNKHIVIDSKAKYEIIVDGGQKYKAEILARDPINDIAILKIAGLNSNEKFPIAELGDSDELELGEPVAAFGNVLGIFRNTVSSGIISGLLRSISARVDFNSLSQEMRGLIQTDAAINPGNSGGPLVNEKGRIIGINTVAVFGAENIGLAIPINVVKKDLADLKEFGRIKQPLLGVRYASINENIRNKFNLLCDYGALIINEGPNRPGVVPNSPADLAGLKEGDVILSINAEKITPEKIIADFLEKYSAGDALTLKVLRGKKEFETKAVLAERK